MTEATWDKVIRVCMTLLVGALATVALSVVMIASGHGHDPIYWWGWALIAGSIGGGSSVGWRLSR